MVSQLIEHGRIETTLPKAKELRRVADRVVTWGKEVRNLVNCLKCFNFHSLIPRAVAPF
jgi:ribosomal protein L17